MAKLQTKAATKRSADKHDHTDVGEEQKHDKLDVVAEKHEEEPEGAVDYNIHHHGLRPSKNKHEKKEGSTGFHHRGLRPSDEARLAVLMAEADDYDDARYAEEQD